MLKRCPASLLNWPGTFFGLRAGNRAYFTLIIPCAPFSASDM